MGCMTTPLTPGTRRTLNILYRFYDEADQLIYVGATTNPAVRFQEHSHHQPWWDEVATIRLERFDSRKKLMAAEAAAIAEEGPRHNTIHAKQQPFRRRKRKNGEGSITQRADGYWQAVIDPKDGGPPKTFYSWDRVEVAQKLEDFRASLSQ